MTAAIQDLHAGTVRAELGRILTSSDFDALERHRHFLRYVDEETLTGHP